ncbi:carbohydrate ABC transporter permease [Stackebrandtia nassauensis]|uniref:Binding-protein-dependent transport systems inner membrane component n=1 Tax=Stackebrandtia nassauensis (strain DSM 44728 / CIP 108903 / NRRL B-16338 / NBRC 102104 / LLR-40K-21) TaxID=446470 RepID=D3QAL0_STANL|nr:sugar ABC transporter permease [Stackebrandtia nassauensis]ADD42793.1 binding-protein-dependent transport systems inner membrane component [Stackebrandtia nassauensis DSM 44728]
MTTSNLTRIVPRRRPGEARAGYGFIALDGLGLIVFVAGPALLALVIGLFDVDGFGKIEFAGFDNFALMAGDKLLWKCVGITAIFTAIFVPTAFVVSLCLALVVKNPYPGVGLVRAALFLPQVISLVVIGVMWKFLLTDKTGVVSGILSPLGLGDTSWLGDPWLALPTVAFISVWFLMGYQMLIFLAGLQDIPNELYDAATVDGANAWQRFWNVTWPCLRPTSFFVLVTSMVNAIAGTLAFDIIYVLTKGGPANSTSTVIFYAYQQAFTYGRFGYAAAICGFVVAVLILLTGAMFAATRGGRFNDA